MTRREAKRYACRVASALCERWLDSDYADEANPSPADNARIERAMLELADELRRRGEGA